MTDRQFNLLPRINLVSRASGNEDVRVHFELKVVYHLQKISGNFGGNFHQVKNVFHLSQERSPPGHCDFTRQN